MTTAQLTHTAHAPKTGISLLKAAALWYAKNGYYVFPLAVGTKKPLKGTHGLDDATTDLGQIKAWWTENPNYNIGINCGLSGLLVVDGDLYKPNAGTLDNYQSDTVKVITAHHGLHLWYRMPAGKHFGNGRGTLPKWLDIKGIGGYICVPPSVLIENGEQLTYSFAPGCKPNEIAIAELPTDIAIVLEAAQEAQEAVSVVFTGASASAPDLTLWWLPTDVVALIHNGAPKGERSEAEWRSGGCLIKAGATDDEIHSVFVHYAIGEKFREKGSARDKHLAHLIGKLRARYTANPNEQAQPRLQLQLAAIRRWVRSPECIANLRASGVRRVADLIPIFDAIIEIAQERRTLRIVTSVRDIADRCGLSSSTAHRRLNRLADVGLVKLTPDPYGTLIDIQTLLDLTGTGYTTGDINTESVPLRSTSDEDFFADHRSDDAFASQYPYKYAMLRRGTPRELIPDKFEDSGLLKSLGPSGLLLWSALASGGTIAQLAEAKGLTEAAVRSTLKRYKQAGLLFIWQLGRSKVYELHPNAEERLDDVRPAMTTYGIGQLRAASNENEKASYAQRKLQGRMPLEASEREKLEIRRDKADGKVHAYYDSLLKMGINPFARVREHGGYRPFSKIDYIEEWRNLDDELYKAFLRLRGISYNDRYFALVRQGFDKDKVAMAVKLFQHRRRAPLQTAGISLRRIAA